MDSKHIIDQMSRDHACLGQLLRAIDKGRWWNADHPSQLAIELILEEALQIHASVSMIAKLLNHMDVEKPLSVEAPLRL
ncbi:hypothetical protein FF100_33365 [Methylobacterium terricola]|uniref:Uncharacterized protein n=1 Tax=Methylobacterium terricola TaxID=2583531 RepID=A0A5C4L8G4_9HYPH|nr:hypothetical protein [Methylobacterium terricola]TNC07131.1 hypothetical protein FF100_33365 [Methylobacterium terricola]